MILFAKSFFLSALAIAANRALLGGDDFIVVMVIVNITQDKDIKESKYFVVIMLFGFLTGIGVWMGLNGGIAINTIKNFTLDWAPTILDFTISLLLITKEWLVDKLGTFLAVFKFFYVVFMHFSFLVKTFVVTFLATFFVLVLFFKKK